jgi:uroporphyrinogen-III synthase
VNKLSPDTVCFAIGNTTAQAIARFTANRIITSELPSQEMMLASVFFYLQNIDQYK